MYEQWLGASGVHTVACGPAAKERCWTVGQPAEEGAPGAAFVVDGRRIRRLSPSMCSRALGGSVVDIVQGVSLAYVARRKCLLAWGVPGFWQLELSMDTLLVSAPLTTHP